MKQSPFNVTGFFSHSICNNNTMEEIDNSSQVITQLYFKLSNAGDLSAIEALIYPQATYSSTNTGWYYGVTDIMTMMTTFFKSQHINPAA